jgi:hypothetical protein
VTSGPNIAKFSGEGLHKKVIANPAFARGEYKTAIKHGFLEMDRVLQHGMEVYLSGTWHSAPHHLMDWSTFSLPPSVVLIAILMDV